MNNQQHLVLGGSGSVGFAVIKELQRKNLLVKTVERSKEVQGVETIKADLLDFEQTKKVIQGASYVYLCVGLPYNSQSWMRDWPRVMRNVIDACATANARLIFLDNVYMYGPPPLAVPFDENHPQNPTTKKGKARKETADLLLEAHRSGKVKAVIGRSADFYGPGSTNSTFYFSFLERMLTGKQPQSIFRKGINHTYAYTTDNGRALVALALDNSTYGQVWHLPVGRPITFDEIVYIFNKVMDTNYKISYLPRILLPFLSIFVGTLNEVREMLYQFDDEYVMSFEKFQKHFPDFKVTSYEEGVKGMINSFK